VSALPDTVHRPRLSHLCPEWLNRATTTPCRAMRYHTLMPVMPVIAGFFGALGVSYICAGKSRLLKFR
jgi:hypothetical protein